MSTTIADVSEAALLARNPDAGDALTQAYETYTASPALITSAALNMIAGSTLAQWYPGIAWEVLDLWGIGSAQESVVVTPASVGEVALRFIVTREQTFDGESTYTVWLVPQPAGGWPANPRSTNWVKTAILIEDPASVGSYLSRASDVTVSDGFNGVVADLGDGTYDLNAMLNMLLIDNDDGTFTLRWWSANIMPLIDPGDGEDGLYIIDPGDS